MVKKTRFTAGADEKTPSRSQYFTWINNTNEGATQAQTLINLDYFRWLKQKYAMQLDIYAFDAGNLDGSRGTYQTPDSPKIRAQFPNGYADVAGSAREIGARLGVWCGPDGFGKTEESANARKELMVSLCRDFNFALFKIDGVCGQLRRNKRKKFIEMMKECRRYQPDLILLNHRLSLGSGMPYATTYLWEGVETYIDVHVANKCTAPHNRAYFLRRNLVPGLERLCEDHGVCISSCPDYFEDDLIYQAFNRCLILAPEIYGNPWLLRDDEQAHLARIYNLHRTYRDILTDAVVLPEEYTKNSTARGNGETQFVTLGNDTWQTKTVMLHLGSEIGLTYSGRVAVIQHHPYERFIGFFNSGELAPVEVFPFRAALIEVSPAEKCGKTLTNCKYEVLHDVDGAPDKVKIIACDGEIGLIEGGTEVKLSRDAAGIFDNTARAPVKLASAQAAPLPENAGQLCEATLFAADNDSLEARALKRSGETAVEQVKAAREAFFNQQIYALRGCEGKFAFDGNSDTFFDGSSKLVFGGLRLDGGCLRVDFGDVYNADLVAIEFFSPYEPTDEFAVQTITRCGTWSADLCEWHASPLSKEFITQKDTTLKAVKDSIHYFYDVRGDRKRITYTVGGDIRYFRLPCPPDRIFKVSLIRGDAELTLNSPKIGNLFGDYDARKAVSAKKAVVRVSAQQWREGCYLAVALEGKHGVEGAYAAAEIDAKPVGFPLRAPSYPSNTWECPVRRSDSFYTYFLPLSSDMTDRDITVYVLSMDKAPDKFDVDIRLCDGNNETDGIIFEL